MQIKNWKPLLLLAPALLIIVACFVLDTPLAKEKARQEKTEQEKVNVETDQPGKRINLNLIVDTVGSPEDGGSTIIYESPDDESEELSKLQYNCAVFENEDEELDDWYKVDLSDTEVGYVKKEDTERVELSIGSDDEIRDQIVKNAIEYIGTPFVRYGDSLSDGIDCANFVQKIYEMSGIYLPNIASDISKEGRQVSESELLPGDLIYYSKANDGTGHVGIYLGNDFIINSSGHSGKKYPRGGVRICRRLYYDRTSYYGINVID